MSDFSKKHYKEIADILKTTDASYHIVEALAELFAKDNPRFDYDKFYQAAGINLISGECGS